MNASPMRYLATYKHCQLMGAAQDIWGMEGGTPYGTFSSSSASSSSELSSSSSSLSFCVCRYTSAKRRSRNDIPLSSPSCEPRQEHVQPWTSIPLLAVAPADVAC